MSIRVPFQFGLVLAALLVAPGLRAQEEATSPRSSPQVFAALRARVEAAVEAGRLPAETGTAADELAFALEREQIRSAAEIEVLKLEAARFTGAEQQGALAALVSAVAVNERRWCEAIRRLEVLATMPTPDAAHHPDDEGKEKGRFDIILEPADLIDDPDP